jgi:hypothetical protein
MSLTIIQRIIFMSTKNNTEDLAKLNAYIVRILQAVESINYIKFVDLLFDLFPELRPLFSTPCESMAGDELATLEKITDEKKAKEYLKKHFTIQKGDYAADENKLFNLIGKVINPNLKKMKVGTIEFVLEDVYFEPLKA